MEIYLAQYDSVHCFHSDSDSDFEKFLENRKKPKKSEPSVEEVKVQPEKRQRKKRRPAKRKAPVKSSPQQYRDKENLLDDVQEDEEMVEVVKPPPPKPRYKPRLTLEEQGVLEGLVGEPGLDKEDVQMFKLALGQLRGEEDSLVEDLPWAHYPHNILSWVNFVFVVFGEFIGTFSAGLTDG